MSCFCVTPICPHSLAARPLIFPDDATLEIKNICQREKMLYRPWTGAPTVSCTAGRRYASSVPRLKPDWSACAVTASMTACGQRWRIIHKGSCRKPSARRIRGFPQRALPCKTAKYENKQMKIYAERNQNYMKKRTVWRR